MKLRIGIIGGGVGGLALAQALRGQDMVVTVFERDEAPTFRNQGYRLTLHAGGVGYLRKILNDDLFQQFVQESYLWNGMRFVDKKLRSLGSIPGEMIPSRSVDRTFLRDLLLADLEDVRFLKEFASYREDEAEVEVSFTDGTSETFDIVIGADGSRSRLRACKFPGQELVTDTGFVDIAARMPWSDKTRQIVESLGTPSFMGVASDTLTPLNIIPQLYLGANEDPEKGYIYWGLVAERSRMEQLTGETVDGDALKRAAIVLTESFHPLLRDMVAASPASEMGLLSFVTSKRPAHWPTSRVTLFGDAVHVMPPLAGGGANTALRDGYLLSQAILDIQAGRRPLLEALGSFEREMMDSAFETVKTSNQNLRRMTQGSALSKRLEHAVLRTVTAVAPSLTTALMRKSL